MRKISTVVSSLMEGVNVMPFFLVKIPDLNLYLTTLQYDVAMSDGNTYLSDGGLVSIDPPRLSNVVDRESYKISIADPDFEFKPYLNNGIVGSELVVFVGFLNTTNATITDSNGDEIEHYQVFKDMRDTIISYKGVIDNNNYEVDFSNNQVMLTLEGSSPLANLDQVKTFYTSKDQMMQVNPNDTSMDEAYKGSEELVIKWGKA